MNRAFQLMLVAASASALCFPADHWIQLNPTGDIPPGAAANSVVYAPTSNRLIVFGHAFGGVITNDLYILSNANGLGGSPVWTHIPVTGLWPSARGAHKAVYDDANDRMIVYGGYFPPSGALSSEVWVLSNASGLSGTPQWSQVAPTGIIPPGRSYPQMAYDPTTNRLIVFGGCTGDSAFACFGSDFVNDVWVLANANGLGGTPFWQQLTPAGAPPGGRGAGDATYDSASNKLIIFGGGAGPTIYNDTWTLLNANGLGGSPQWVHIIPSISTTDRYNFAMGYRASQNYLVVAMGVSQSALTNSAWKLSNATGVGISTWTQLAPTGPLPPIRDSISQGGYDAANGRLIVFGGTDSSGYLNDVWVLVEGEPADSTPPTITPNISGTLGTNNWYTSDVNVTWSVNDPESAISSSTGCGATTVSTDTAGVTLTCSATSTGGTESQSLTIKRDAAPPLVAVTGVASGGSYPLGAVPVAGCSTTDSMSGVATNATPNVTGGTANGVGSFTATCSGATDNAGNAASSVSVTYSVQYNFLGFFAPVNMGIWNTLKAGQTVPMKWQLRDGANNYISALTVVTSITSANVACTAGTADPVEIADTSGASGLRYDLSSNQYIFSWQTAKSWAGTCRRFYLKLDDGTTKTADFQLK